MIRSTPGGTTKRYRVGAHRCRTPAETLALVSPHLRRFGITRVANVTGLDRIGIPIFMVVRPNSRSLAVSQGKGAEPDASRVSGIMEAVEFHCAEYLRSPVRIESYSELRRHHRVADPDRLPLIRDSPFTTATPVPWVEGTEVFTDTPVWVPLEMVHANATVPAVPGSGCFDRSSNGLASGNTWAEAVLHAVCEIVERDAIALWQHGGPDTAAATRLDLATVDDPVARDLLDRYERSEISVMAWDVTSDVGLAAFEVLILDQWTDPVLNPMPTAFGAGCHPDRGVALVRALAEAAQSRLTTIAGSRDDLSRGRYRAFQAGDVFDHHRAVAADPVRPRRFPDVPSSPADTVDDDLAAALRRLRSVGVEQVIVVDLSPAEPDVAVVRVVVPGLEGPTESDWYRPGPRARAVLAGAGR